MEVGGILLILTIVAMPIALVWSVFSEYRKSKRQEEADQEAAERWLAEEMKQPRYRVVVTTKGGLTLMTEPLEPFYQPHWYSGRPQKVPSAEHAENQIKNTFKREYFNQDDVYIPLCEIERMEVVQV